MYFRKQTVMFSGNDSVEVSTYEKILFAQNKVLSINKALLILCTQH